MKTALVVFGGESSHLLRGILEDGFKHCFVTILSHGYWIEIDQIRGRCVIRVVAGGDFDMRKHYEDSGYEVLTVHTNRPHIWKFNPFYGNIMVSNCVGLVKTVLCLNSWALTPFQLFKELKK